MLNNRLRISDTSTMLNNRLRISDTSTMLNNRLRISDTLTMLSNRLRISDTATMLSRRITKDTASLSSRIDLRVRDVADEFNYGTTYSPAITVTVTNVSGTNYNYIGFPLTQKPHTSSKVKMFINGIRVSNTCYTLSNNIITYKPDLNSGYNLIASDRIQFDYYY